MILLVNLISREPARCFLLAKPQELKKPYTSISQSSRELSTRVTGESCGTQQEEWTGGKTCKNDAYLGYLVSVQRCEED